MTTIDEFYNRTVGQSPYPYQRRLAMCPSLPDTLAVPTGVGKTAAVVLGWLYRRRFAGPAVACDTPRRLVYCLPMRTLVEQVAATAERWLTAIGLDEVVGLHVLMGGAEAGDWRQYPERDAIIVGTQDMLLSRALFRGYGASPASWPVDAALLGSDCLWVCDETQLMGPALATTAQLAAFRRAFGTAGPFHTLWLSATLDAGRLATRDHQRQLDSLGLDNDDLEDPAVARLVGARKACSWASTRATGRLATESKLAAYAKGLAAEVAGAHVPGTRTIVVCNTVVRAQRVYAAIESNAAVHLLHSRMRGADRATAQAAAIADVDPSGPGVIVVATQAIEAGVDITSATLFTELAPWSSLVQRAGRCNRRGECAAARVIVVDIGDEAAPYDAESLARSREALDGLSDLGSESIASVVVGDAEDATGRVLTRADLLDLCDTTADASGRYADVSGFVRDADDTDVTIYWRAWDGDSPPRDIGRPCRAEVCSVPVGRMRSFLGAGKEAWAWDSDAEAWVSQRAAGILPGQTLLLHTTAGGYSPALGWVGESSSAAVAEILPPPAAYAAAFESGGPVPLAEHLDDVAGMCQEIVEQLDASMPWEAAVVAARWHDVGKAHAAFQHGLRSASGLDTGGLLLAKSGGTGRLIYETPRPDGGTDRRDGFRHEAASTLAWMAQHDDDLVAYLIAAHHGKVRMRAVGDYGLRAGDVLPGVGESEQVTLEGAGLPGWGRRAERLIEKYGPFKLALMEAVVRVADWRVSRAAAQREATA